MNAITSTGTSQGQDKRAEFEAWHAKNFKHMQPWPEFARSESFPEEYLDLYMQKRWEGWQARARSSPPESTRTANSHPEDFCQQCGGPNFVWFAANDVWNKVIPERVGVLCPRCFAERAKRVGFGVAWELVPQREPAAGIKSEEGPPDGASASGQAACG